MPYKFLLFCFCFCCAIQLSAQSDNEKALAHIREAERQMDAGNYEKATDYYRSALKLVPDNPKYLYGLALAYYRAENYPKAIEFAEKVLQKSPDLDTFRLLGNSYDLNNEYQKGIDVLYKGLEKFPNNGALFLDMGIIDLIRSQPQLAVERWEAGIQADPSFADNYFFAAQTYSRSDQKVWALLYGEVFMNIERGTARWDTMSRLLYNLYSNLLQNADYLQNGEVQFLPKSNNAFEQANLRIYDILRKNGMMNPDRAKKTNGKTNNLKLLSMVRNNFLEMWLQIYAPLYSNNLFDNHRQMMDKGYFEAYNNWLFSPPCTNDFLDWKANNELKYSNFIDWFLENPLKVDIESYFVRGQYENK